MLPRFRFAEAHTNDLTSDDADEYRGRCLTISCLGVLVDITFATRRF